MGGTISGKRTLIQPKYDNLESPATPTTYIFQAVGPTKLAMRSIQSSVPCGVGAHIPPIKRRLAGGQQAAQVEGGKQTLSISLIGLCASLEYS